MPHFLATFLGPTFLCVSVMALLNMGLWDAPRFARHYLPARGRQGASASSKITQKCDSFRHARVAKAEGRGEP